MDTEMVLDDPLPAPTGAAAMAMFLEPRGVAPPPRPADARPAAAAADAQPPNPLPAAQPEPQRAQPPRPPPPAAQQQQQTGMSRLDYETCIAMHGILAKYKEADPFRQPVDVEALGIPDYVDIIKKPMDLKTVREKLRQHKYRSVQEWRADIQLIWDNARKYNGENHPVSNQAAKLEAAVDRRMESAVEIAKANMSAEARGEPRPRKSMQPRNTELNALLSDQLGSSDSDSMDEPAAGGAAAAAAAGRRSPEKVVVKRERDADAGSGRPAKRRVPPGPSTAAAAAGSNQGILDLDTLSAMVDTPWARQLGADEPDDLAFLALWKRCMNRKQQLASAAAASEPLRKDNQQLRSSLARLQEDNSNLTQRLRDEAAARRAAVEAKAEVENRLMEMQSLKENAEAELQSQKNIMDAQRELLEQQQSVLRKLAHARQALVDQGKLPASQDKP